MDTVNRSALIVGGGIGGLTTAITLRRAGWDVEVTEIKDGWTVAGWGLSVTGPALRALAELGLAGPCIAAGYPITQLAHCDPGGEVRREEAFPSLLGEGRPAQAGMARPELARILRTAAVEAGAVLRNSLTVTGVRENPESVTATLSDGSARTVDVVVGADGVFSKIRKLIGRTEEPAYTGQMVWRALVPRPEWGTRVTTFNGSVHNAGLIPISPSQAYCFVTENTDDPEFIPDDALADGMRAILAPFTGKLAQVRDQITDPGSVVRRPAHAICLDAPWHAGRVALLGDAAHSPSPQLTSGTALAVEDALVLTEELDRSDDVATALKAYSARRLPRARLVVEISLKIAEAERAGRVADSFPLHGQAHGALAGPI